jgi:hypothetical protein
VAKNGDEIDIIEPDWLGMERRKIDALGPKFEALVDILMREMDSVPEKREEVRRCLYHDLTVFGNQSGLYQEIDNAKPREWLNRVHHAAKVLKDLLDDATEVWPTPDAEWADLRGRLPGGVLTRLAGDVSRLVAVTKDTSDVHRSVGRRRAQALQDFVGDLVRLTNYTLGRKQVEAVGAVAVLTKVRRRRVDRFFGS